MEERNIWLPAWLESSGLEPDDRATHRGNAGKPKRPNQGPTASGTWQPYDPDRPESKRSRSAPESKKAEPPASRSHPKRKSAAKPKPEARRKPKSKSKAKRKSEAKAKPLAKREVKAKSASKPKAERKSEAKAKPAKVQRTPDREGGPERERSDVDAMGQDKHRRVIGQRYGASRAKQFAYYGIFVAFVVGAYIGLKAAADHLDKAPAHDAAQAPWSKPGAPNEPLGGFAPRTAGQKGPTNFQ